MSSHCDEKEVKNVKTYAEITKSDDNTMRNNSKTTLRGFNRKQNINKERENINEERENINEEREKKKRSSNLMIYGVPETSNKSDHQWMANLLSKLYTPVKYKRNQE